MTNKKPLLGGSGAEVNTALNLPAKQQTTHPGELLLEWLKKAPYETWFRTITPGKGANRRRKGADLDGWDLAALEADNRAGASIYFITGEAAQATGTDKKGNPTGAVQDSDVTSCPALFAEWDDRPIEWQLQAWQELGLPEPSAMVTTGGKSVHCYWVLAEPMDPAEWRVLQSRLIDYCGSDAQCKNPSRLMRLPGFEYIDKKTGKGTGNFAELVHLGEGSYTAAEIEACLPAPAAAPAPAQTLVHKAKAAAKNNTSRKDLPARTVDEINAAAECIPRRVANKGTYPEDRNALCGCSAALDDAGIADPDNAALALLGHLWPSEKEARQVLASTSTRKAESFWAIAKKSGYRLQFPDQAAEDFFGDDLPPPTTSPAVEPASFDALIQRLPDGWVPQESGPDKPSQLTPGALSQMLPTRSLRHNEMTLRAEVLTSSGWQQIKDPDMDSAYVLLSSKGWKIGVDPVLKAILHVARQSPIHPLRDYLQSIENNPDIQPFDLDAVAEKFFRCKSKLHAAMVRKWLIGAVNRVFVPGCQMDYVLVLHGLQGLLKSSAFKALASPDWHCSTAPQEEKDFLLNVHSCWIYELAELEAITRGRASGKLKNLITTSIDTVRPPYGRTAERLPRASVFGGSCNEDTFLVDSTGDRRYWVLPITGTEKLDIAALAAARDSIWKAAIADYRKGVLPMLSEAEELRSSAQNQQFNQHDPWVDMVAVWMEGDPLIRWDPDKDPSTMVFDPTIPFTSAEVLYSAGLRRTDAITRLDEMRVSEVLRLLGFEKGKQQRVGAAVVRKWQLSQPSQPSQPPAAEVVTPQNPTGAVGLPLPSQPSQPKTGKKQIKKTGESTEAAQAHATRPSSEIGCDGCDTPKNPVQHRGLAVTTSNAEVVTEAPEVVTEAPNQPVSVSIGYKNTTRASNEQRLKVLRPSVDPTGWSDDELLDMVRTLEEAHTRRAASTGIAIPEVA